MENCGGFGSRNSTTDVRLTFVYSSAYIIHRPNLGHLGDYCSELELPVLRCLAWGCYRLVLNSAARAVTRTPIAIDGASQSLSRSLYCYSVQT